MNENQEFAVGDVVFDGDGYEAEIASIDLSEGVAILDYSSFPADVPAEATEWPLDELELAD